jgi:hypothetical protein
MRRRLDELLEEDTVSRWRIISISALAVAVFGACVSALTHKAISEVQLAACVVGAMVFSAQVIRYCLRTEGIPEQHTVIHGMTPKLRRTLILAVTSAVVPLLLSLPAPLLEGAVLNRKLRGLAQQQVPLSENSVGQIIDAITEASNANVRIPGETKVAIRSALRQTAVLKPALSNKAVTAEAAVASYSTAYPSRKLQAILSQETLRAEATGKEFVFTPIATNTGPDNYLTTEISRQPDVARMERLDNISPLASDYGPGFLIVQGLSATIDGFYLRRIIFKNMRLTYHGGPLVMEQVYFLECQFEMVASPNVSRLLGILDSAGPVYFSASQNSAY